MSRLLPLLLFSLVLAGSFSENKVVKIVQEPANYGGLQSRQSSSLQSKSKLKSFRKESPFSGPYHLKKLYGKCFSLTDNNYKYDLCPFINITQHEQTWRWNAFQGILGIWKEWSIVNNTFEAMVMTDGDRCPGNLRRESKIYFKCANSNSLVSVKEPSTCKYEVTFKTPLACPVDAFLVYPALSPEGQEEWEEIEKGLYHEELTLQGYQKRRRHLFIRAGLLAPLQKIEKQTSEVNKSVNEEKLKNKLFVPKSTFRTKEECSLAYADLLVELLKIRQLQEKQNPSEKANNISEISNVELAVNHVLGARGDTGIVDHEPYSRVPHTRDEKKQPLTESPSSVLRQNAEKLNTLPSIHKI